MPLTVPGKADPLRWERLFRTVCRRYALSPTDFGKLTMTQLSALMRFDLDQPAPKFKDPKAALDWMKKRKERIEGG